MDNVKIAWYAAYGIEPEYPSGEPTVEFSPIIKWEGNAGLDWTEDIGLTDPRECSNFLCYIDTNDPENPRV
jgi:hypothetical protein